MENKQQPTDPNEDNFNHLPCFKELAEFKALKERTYEALDALFKQTENQVREVELMKSITRANFQVLRGHQCPELLLDIIEQLAELNYPNVGASFDLDFWCRQYGREGFAPIFSDIIQYFIRQLEVTENLTDEGLAYLAHTLLANLPQLKIKELLFVLNKAVNGEYEATGNRVGVDTVLGWLSQYYHESATHLQATLYNYTPENPDDTRRQQLQHYETQQREKQRLVDEVWERERKGQGEGPKNPRKLN